MALASVLFGLPARAADDLGAVKQRMEQRLANVVALKQTGRVGENNRGLLQALEPVSDAEKALVEAENRDRQTVYAAIAKKVGGTAEAAGALRARQIADSAPAGTKIQDAKGKWTTK